MKITSKKATKSPLTSQQLTERLTNKTCCGKEMTLTETYPENNKICFKYTCSQCQSSLFTYGEKPKKSITLTANQYETLLNEMKNIYQILYQAKSGDSR
jgi:hypothetical protein